MKITLWENGDLKESSLEGLGVEFSRRVWVDIADPTVEDLEKVTAALNIPRHILVGRLHSNYPHADTYPEYTKIFAWYLAPATGDKEFSFHRNPVAVLTNGISVITIAHSRTNIHERISTGLGEMSIKTLSLPVQVIYLTMIHVLERYEYFAEQFEATAERLEEEVPPWPLNFYMESFNIRKDASNFLRMIRHFRTLADSLIKGRLYLPITDDEKRLMDTIYDRAMGTEEIAETSLEIVRDLIEMHLDTVSHEMNRAMRLMAAITCIVAIPSVIGALLGMNLIDVPWPWHLWQVTLIGASTALLLGVYFHKRGWLGGTK